MYFLPRLDVGGNHPVWLVLILPVTSISFRKMIWVLMEGVLVSGTRTRVREGFGDGTFLVDLNFFGLDGDDPWPWPRT